MYLWYVALSSRPVEVVVVNLRLDESDELEGTGGARI
jgi:hypothetical protein